MSFSVLMSLYAKERPLFLRQSLDSVFGQTLKPDEVIFVEDGPLTSELYSVVEKYCQLHPEMKVIPLPVNGGLGKALNVGLKHCSNELIARMDTDDIALPDRFEKQVEFMAENPDVDICSGWLNEFESDIANIKSVKKVPATHSEISDYIKSRNPLNHPVVMFRKSAVEKAGGYRHFPLFEDWYLWARMMASGAKFANIQRPLVNFRISPNMYKRRGGIGYAMDSARFQWTLHRLGIISVFHAIKSALMRGVVYILPNTVRALIYSKLLRS